MKKRIGKVGKVGKVGLNVVKRLHNRIAAVKSHAREIEELFIEQLKERKKAEIEEANSRDLAAYESSKAEWLFCKLMACNGKGAGLSADEIRALLHDYSLFNSAEGIEYETKKKARLKEKNIESSFYYNYGILANL